MAQFLVKIADDRGRLAQQVENGYSESEVRERFVQQGYLVYWVKPQRSLCRRQVSAGRTEGQAGPFVIFNQQFLTLIKAGLPILNALDLLIKRQKDGNMRSLLQNVRERVKSGELLSDSFAAQGVFPRDLYHHADGGGKERQHRGSAGPLHRFSATGSDVQEEVGGIPGLPGAAGDDGDGHDRVSGHLRSARVCQAL